MTHAPTSPKLEPFPPTVLVEELPISAFPNPESLFERISLETQTTWQSRIAYLNIHVANTAFHYPDLKGALWNASLIYCDGAGIVTGARLLGLSLPERLTAADWFLPMLEFFSRKKHRVYLLGGAPGVPEATLNVIRKHIPEHSVIGAHHGYILDNPDLESHVIAEINELRPDILLVGFGTPLQELWIERNGDKISTPVLYGIGAVMDFVSGKVSRCPVWMGKAGLEWLYRFYTEPNRLMIRYLIGNPWFLSRMAFRRLLGRRSFQRKQPPGAP